MCVEVDCFTGQLAQAVSQQLHTAAHRCAVGLIPRELAKIEILRIPQYAEKCTRGEKKGKGNGRVVIFGVGLFSVQTNKQSAVSSSGLERYFVHSLWYWFVICLYSGSSVY